MAYMPLSGAQVGDRVEYGYRGGWSDYLPQAIVAVTAVGANYIKTDDGKKWKMNDGREWGEKYSSVMVSRFDAETEAHWAETRERNAAELELYPLIKDPNWVKHLSVKQI